ncbi:MAG: uroporphyrinogen-III C-methyltransferase, partial [Burkholderiales bacterium]
MSDAPPLSTPAPPTPSSAPRRSPLNPLWIVVGLAALAIVWGWYDARRELRAIKSEVTQRLHAAELDGRESRTIAKKAEDDARSATAKLSLIDERLGESRSQQVALEQLYQQLARGGDEWLLAEIEQMLAIASQQLQLAGNVRGALVALQTAVGRLGPDDRTRADRTHLYSVRVALQGDIEQLQRVPNLDIPGLTLRLDRIIELVDGMTLLADGRPQPMLQEHTEGENMWSRVSGLVWGEVRQLIRIQRLDRSDQGLLSPEQSYFLRENLKLR